MGGFEGRSNHRMWRTPSGPSATRPPPPSMRCPRTPQVRGLCPARQEVPPHLMPVEQGLPWHPVPGSDRAGWPGHPLCCRCLPCACSPIPYVLVPCSRCPGCPPLPRCPPPPCVLHSPSSLLVWLLHSVWLCCSSPCPLALLGAPCAHPLLPHPPAPPHEDFTSPHDVDCPVRSWLVTALLPPPWRGVSCSPDGLFAQQEEEPTRGRPALRGKGTCGVPPGQRVEEQGTCTSLPSSQWVDNQPPSGRSERPLLKTRTRPYTRKYPPANPLRLDAPPPPPTHALSLCPRPLPFRPPMPHFCGASWGSTRCSATGAPGSCRRWCRTSGPCATPRGTCC